MRGPSDWVPMRHPNWVKCAFATADLDWRDFRVFELN